MRKIELSEHFTYRKLMLYSLPSIGEALAITSFQMVDGGFVSNYLGMSPFAAVNIVSPVFFILYGFGFLFGSGTSAVVSQLMGEGDRQRGNQVFTLSVVVMALFGAVLGALTTALMPTLSRWAGANEGNLPYCIAYGRTLTAFLPLFLINGAFMTLWITAEKAWIGMAVSVVNGCLNILMDWLFMGPLGWGIEGAALATSLSASAGAVFTVVYFFRKNGSSLRFVRFTREDAKQLIPICTNGASEMIDAVSGNITQLVMNNQLDRLTGEIGIAAMGVYSYVVEFFMAIFFGISSTAVTVVGYKYGEKNKKELDSIRRKNTILTLGFGVLMCGASMLLAGPISGIYLGYDAQAFNLAVTVLRISSLSCLGYGFILFTSALFTGMGDGLTSAVISASNSLVVPVIMIYLLPAVFGTNGIWYATPAATLVTALLCAFFLRTRYDKRIAMMKQ